MPFINDMLEESARKKSGSHSTNTDRRQSRFLFDPDRVMAALNDRILGQAEMKRAVDDMLRLVKGNFSDPVKPLSVMLFLGPTGVGKTETVRVLAEAIYGDAGHVCRVDMNTLSQQHYAAALSGAPPGYVGSKEGHTLFNREMVAGSFSKPGIVLFDEIEKSGRDVTRTLLNILDNGTLQLAGGVGEIDFRNSLIFMTSNIGAKEVMAARESGVRRFFRKTPFGIADIDIYKRSLRRHFDPEFLNRIHNTIVFNEIEFDQLDALIDLELKKLHGRLKAQGIGVRLTSEVRASIKAVYDSQYGARDLSRRFRQYVEIPLAKTILTFAQSDDFLITEKHGSPVAEPLHKP